MKLNEFKDWAKTHKQVIIAVGCGVVICAAGITGSQIYIRNNSLPVEDTTEESKDYSAYDITTEPETETTVVQEADRTIIKDEAGNETVNRTWSDADVTEKANANGGGSEIKTDSNGTYHGEQETTTKPAASTSSTPKNGDTKVVNGITYRYDSVFGWVEYTAGGGGCIGDARQSNDEDYNTPADGIYM